MNTQLSEVEGFFSGKYLTFTTKSKINKLGISVIFYRYGIKCLNSSVLFSCSFFYNTHYTIVNITSVMDFTVKASGVIFLCQPRFFFLFVNRKLSGNSSFSRWQQPEHERRGPLWGGYDGQGWGGGETVQQHDGEHRGWPGHWWVSQLLCLYISI